jgi:PAS domain S-box-containing protein
LRDPKRRTEARAAIESKKLTLAGPFTLIQGGVAVIGRLPVFLVEENGKESFWGFTAVLIHLDELFQKANLDRLITSRYAYELFRINPDTGKNDVIARSVVAAGQTGKAHALDPVQHHIEVPNGEWILSIAPIGGWGKKSLLKGFIALVVVVSGALSWMVYSQLRKSEILANEIELRTHEITQRQKVEEALKESEKKYRSLFESAPMGIGLTTLDGQILALNDTFVQMSGYLREEAKEINVRNSYYKPEDRDVLLRQLELDGFVREFETVLRRKDGSLFDASLTITKLVLGGQNVILTVASDITHRKRTLAKLKESEEQLRNLYARVQSAREEERLNISREVHDDLGQMLTALKMDLTWLKKRFPKDQKSLVEKSQSMSQLFDATIQTVRKICAELRPTLLEDFGIAAAVESQIEEFEARTGIKCQVTMEPDKLILDDECSIVLFRIFQETLTNITRHANATQVQVTVQIANDHVILEVEDNGKGINESQISDSKSLGLLGMRERAYSAGGKFEICGRPNAGTTIKVSIPLN